MTPMYGPAVRCKRFPRSWRYGLASMYPASDWSMWLQALMDISARVNSLADKPRAGYQGHQGSYAPGRPILHRRLILSQTSAGKSRYCKLRHRYSPCLGLFLCSRLGGRSFVPACGLRGAPRARTVKAGRRGDVATCAGVSRPRLDGPEHGARIKQVGAHWS